MKNNFKIKIETTGGYGFRKEFELNIELTDREYLALASAVLDFTEKLTSVGSVTSKKINIPGK